MLVAISGKWQLAIRREFKIITNTTVNVATIEDHDEKQQDTSIKLNHQQTIVAKPTTVIATGNLTGDGTLNVTPNNAIRNSWNNKVNFYKPL